MILVPRGASGMQLKSEPLLRRVSVLTLGLLWDRRSIFRVVTHWGIRQHHRWIDPSLWVVVCPAMKWSLNMEIALSAAL